MINNHNSFIGIFVAGLALAGFGGDAFAYLQMGTPADIGNNTTYKTQYIRLPHLMQQMALNLRYVQKITMLPNAEVIVSVLIG